MRSRAYAITLVLLAAGALSLLAAYGATWAVESRTLLEGAEGATREASLSGRDLYPLAGACGWVALAAVGGIIATRSWGRTAVALIALLAGVGGAAGGVMAAGLPARSGAGWLLAVLAGVVVAVAALACVVRGRSWPSLGRRYERTAPRRREVSAWDTQDMGGDPTDDLVE